MADGLFYRDMRIPTPIVVDEQSVTLAATAKALWPGARTTLPANYFRVGKVLKLTAYGKYTSGTTPGNGTPTIYCGTGADANGVHADGVARALVASVTNIMWRAEAYIECRSIGSTGTVRMYGHFDIDLAGQLSTNQPNLIPGATPADATVDTTGTLSVTIQYLRSGSTAESMVTTNLQFEALN